MTLRRGDHLFQQAERMKARVGEDLTWSPTPVILVGGLVLFLSLFFSLYLNSRIGRQSDLVTLAAPQKAGQPIWMSLRVSQDRVIVTSPSHSFSWPAANPSAESTQALRDWLKKEAQQILEHAAHSGLADPRRAEALLSVEQTMSYGQVKPVIYALAEAGISNYSFETALPPHEVKR